MNIVAKPTLPAEINSTHESAPKKGKGKGKRETKTIDSCVSADWMRRDHNAGKAQALENPFVCYRCTSTEVVDTLWKATLSAEKIEVWRIVSPSDTIVDRRSLSVSTRLVKKKEGLSWQAQGECPWLKKDEHSRLLSMGIKFPRLWEAVVSYPKKQKKQAKKTAASSAACSLSGVQEEDRGRPHDWTGSSVRMIGILT